MCGGVCGCVGGWLKPLPTLEHTLEFKWLFCSGYAGVVEEKTYKQNELDIHNGNASRTVPGYLQNTSWTLLGLCQDIFTTSSNYFQDIFKTPTGNLQGTSVVPPGLHKDISNTFPGHQIDTTRTPSENLQNTSRTSLGQF